MDEYPNPDEEFELMYGDEQDLIQSQYFPENVTVSQIPNSQTVVTEQLKDTNLEIEQNSKIIEDSQTNNDTITISKKRTIEELFGEIDDILYEDDVNYKKKQKKQNGHDDDYALIDHILELRRLAKERNNVSLKFKDKNDIAIHCKNNLSYQVPKYSFTTVTRFDGQRIYVRCHSEQFMKEEQRNFKQNTTFAGCMGDVFKDIWKEAQLLINKQLDTSDGKEMEVEPEIPNLTCDERESDAQLWVDLYKPKKYFELLSDESTNRILLKWFKLWDKIVFNRAPKIKLKPDISKQKKFYKPEFSMNLDENGCPQYKVVLMCGPPGLGKTTLAHLVATHAGYNVVEVNASDDRSTENFKRMLENSTQMSSVIDRNHRPNCLVFDEIDGAPSSSIDFLIKYVTGSTTSKKKRKSTEGKTILKRPIVCICNDVYVPALRPLRQIAFVVNFPPTASVRLAERLQEIARHQKIKTDIGALLALCEKTGNDIRSCLSLLHFLKSLNKPVTLSYVNKANVGQKDMHKGLFAVWQDIFQIQRMKYNPSEGSKENDDSNYIFKTRMQKILQVVHAFGDYERLIQGIFENYLNLKLKDSTLEGITNALDWFCFTDIVNNRIHTLQNYSLSTYVQYGFVIWHFLFATTGWQKLSYPSVGYEVKLKATKQSGLLGEILKGMRPNARAFTSIQPLKLDTLPLLYDIITPLFRPVNIHLYTQQEKDQLVRIVAAMIDYNLNYVQERVPEVGTYVYMMDPNIEEIVSYRDVKKRRVLPYTIKQLIAREIELEKMRHIEQSKTDSTKNVTNKEKERTTVPNHLQNLKPKSVKPKGNGIVTRDFFGRVITKKSNASKTEMEIKHDVWFQYKEGYNNAVRKHIKIATLK